MNKKLSLNRNQLKLIAIISMVIDHTAWGFLDFYTPLAQFLHVCGRFTIPIMCFFVAEGFKKTHDLKKYISRMITFAAISVIPFYIFFHEEYEYRQNIIFDLLLGLLMLTTLESSLKKWQKTIIATVIFSVSGIIGGWVIEPILFILIFYYGKTFKEKVKWFVIADVGMVAFLVVAISLNQVYHFSHYNWVWWDKFYLLGFMLALPLLYCYNGEKGRQTGGRYFFYFFYPAHFMVLAAIKAVFVTHVSSYTIYAAFHIVAFILGMMLMVSCFNAKESKGQNGITIFLSFADIYILGFILEIYGQTAEAYYMACIVQYVGEFVCMIAAIYFVGYMCKKTVPFWLISLHILTAVLLLYGLLKTRETGFFYSYIGVNNDGPFHRPELVHSTGFYLSLLFLAVISIEIIYMCVSVLIDGTEIDKKRVRMILLSLAFCWLPYGLTLTGITGGYEVPALGLCVAGVFLFKSFIRYGTLDSVALASENALDHGHEGILVLDNRYRISYHNSLVDSILGDFPHNRDVHEWPIMNDFLSGKISRVESNGRIYDIDLEPLMENGYEEGKMIWLIDSTEHYAVLDTMAQSANHDGLTGLYNRLHFKELVDADVKEGREGTFLMIDMDNFKQVNDVYGHQRGDYVLKSLADILSSYSEEKMFACRVGGDEFCAYLRDVTDKNEITQLVNEIFKKFGLSFRADDEVRCTISMGIYINSRRNGGLKSCSVMYSDADKKLYEAKGAGKNTFCI